MIPLSEERAGIRSALRGKLWAPAKGRRHCQVAVSLSLAMICEFLAVAYRLYLPQE